MATVTFPISHVPVACAKIAYALPTDTASTMLTAVNTAVVTDFGWTLADTFGTTSVYSKTFNAVTRYVSVELDFSGSVEKIKVKGYGDWDAEGHLPVGAEYLPQRHEVNLGRGSYSWAVFAYERPTATMFLQLTNRP